jgi:hypothetical protein
MKIKMRESYESKVQPSNFEKKPSPAEENYEVLYARAINLINCKQYFKTKDSPDEVETDIKRNPFF